VLFRSSYESAITPKNAPEQLLPNMYAFYSELKNEEQEAKNVVFRQHITLAGTIPDVFVDVTNDKGELIFVKDQGEYFDKFSLALTDLLRLNPPKPEEQELIRRFTNLVCPVSNIDLFKSFNQKRELFPMYFDISFSTDNSTLFSQILQDSQLSSVLIKDIIDGNIKSETLQFQESTITSYEQGPKLLRTVMSDSSSLRTWDIQQWVDRLTKNPAGEFGALGNGTFLGIINDETRLATTTSYNLFKNLMILVFVGELKTLINTNLRSYDDIIHGKLAYSENVFYRIEKSDAATGNVIQNFYIPNTNQIDTLRFIDTQVKYNKQYIYKVFVYQMVLGNKYYYILNSVQTDVANINVINEPSIKLVEILMNTFTGRVMDEPPIPPELNILPYKGINNQILFNLVSPTGEYRLKPIIIEPTDNVIFKQLREAQMKKENEFLSFKTDDRIAAFEIFRLDTKPFKYQDFTGKRIALVPTDYKSTITTPSQHQLQTLAATAASFIDNILPNKKYYYVFRSIDNHGHISNPTSVFQIEIVDADGSIYPVVEVVDFEKNSDLQQPFKPMKKFIQIVPAFEQKILNEQKSGLIVDGERAKSVLNVEQVHLGVAEEQVWGKTFRIRLTSRQTGKKIDFNISFDQKHLKKA